MEPEAIAGKMCEVWESALGEGATKTWTWKGIRMKTYSKMPMMEMTAEAISIKLGVPIGDDKLAAPADAKITESAAPSLDMEKLPENLKKILQGAKP